MAHLRYISRPEAVRGRVADVLLYQLPSDVGVGNSFATLRAQLQAYAQVREWSERKVASRTRRTHYRTIFSFERTVPNDTALALVRTWLETCFPDGRGMAFLHRNSAHLHAHVWLEARQRDGRQVHLDAQRYHRLDEVWNRHYSQVMGRDECEHLQKKQETREYRQRCREGESPPPPERAAGHWCPARFTERERRRLETGRDERQEIRTGSDQPPSARGRADPLRREPGSPARKRTLTQSSLCQRQAALAADQTLREVDRLRAAFACLGERTERGRRVERREGEQDRGEERER